MSYIKKTVYLHWKIQAIVGMSGLISERLTGRAIFEFGHTGRHFIPNNLNLNIRGF